MADLLTTLSITHLEEVGSTSDLAQIASRDGAAEGTAFRADIQTSGRGRHGRDWVSPKGNLYLSVLLRPSRPMAEWPGLALMAGLALRDALLVYRDAGRITLKWPNDVLLDGRKVAGLLLEVHDGAVILGCGVNCLHAPEKTTGWTPGWLNQAAEDPPVTADQVMETLAETLCDRYNDWQKAGLASIRDDWKAAAAHLGKTIVARQSDGATLSGIFEDLGADGSMVLRLADGRLKAITAADVVQTRPEDKGPEDKGPEDKGLKDMGPEGQDDAAGH